MYNNEPLYNAKQNNPELIVTDLCRVYPDIDPDVVRHILLHRGVNKWFAVRRDLIRLKILWRMRLTMMHLCLVILRKKGRESSQDQSANIYGMRRSLRVLHDCYNSIRALCHGPRLVVWNGTGIVERGWPHKLRRDYEKVQKCINQPLG